MQQRRKAWRYVDRMHRCPVNAVRLNARNTDAHEEMKYRICRQLNREGKEFLTECILQNGRRVDILVLDDVKIIEILASETERQCAQKVQAYYSAHYEIVFVDASQPWTELDESNFKFNSFFKYTLIF